MKILIYEDNHTDKSLLKKRIDDLFPTLNINYQIDECLDVDVLLDNIYQYDILFLDIEVGEKNGIEIGMKVREKYPNLIIVITSNYKKYLLDGYKIKANRYLLKPISEQQFNLDLKEVIKEYLEKNISIYDEKISKVRIRMQNILYVEFIDKRSWLILTTGKKLSTPYPLHYWADQLCKYSFAKCYKSIIVNCNYVDDIDKNDLILTTSEKIPVSRNYKKSFEQKWIESMRKLV